MYHHLVTLEELVLGSSGDWFFESLIETDAITRRYWGIYPERRFIMIYSLTNNETAVIGASLVGGTKAIRNMDTIFQEMARRTERSCPIKLVVFSLTAPKGELANCAPDSGAVVINLMHTFCKSYDKIIDETEMQGISINALFWHNMYVSIIHEALHLYDPELSEEDVSASAKVMAFEIARDYALEPGSCEFIREQMNELAQGAKEGDFFDTQKRMFDEGLWVWYKPTESTLELKLSTFRAYMHFASGAEDNDIRWTSLPKMAVVSIAPSLTAEAPPIQVPVQTVSAPVQTAVAPAMASATTSMNAPVQFADDGWDDGFDNEPGIYGEFATATDDDFDENYAGSGGMVEFAKATMAPPQPIAVATPQPAPIPMAQATFSTMTADQHTGVKVTLPKTGLSAQQTSDIARGVYTKCFHAIFACGQLTNSDKAFSNPELVAQNTIALTEQEKQVVVAMNFFHNGRWVKAPTTNGLIGYIGKFKALPTYKLFINNDGVEMCRLVLPQNPGKLDGNGQYTKTAIMARGGAKIVYVMEGDDNAKANGAKQYICKAVVAPGSQLTQWEAC